MIIVVSLFSPLSLFDMCAVNGVSLCFVCSWLLHGSLNRSQPSNQVPGLFFRCNSTHTQIPIWWHMYEQFVWILWPINKFNSEIESEQVFLSQTKYSHSRFSMCLPFFPNISFFSSASFTIFRIVKYFSLPRPSIFQVPCRQHHTTTF